MGKNRLVKNAGQLLQLVGTDMTAGETRTFRVQAVDDHIHDADAEALQFPDQIQRLLDAQGLGQHNRDKPALFVILEEFFHLLDGSGESFDEVIEVVPLIGPPEKLLHVPVFG